MKKSRCADNQIMAALKRVETGLAVPDACRKLGLSTATFFKWRAKFAGRPYRRSATTKSKSSINSRSAGMISLSTQIPRAHCVVSDELLAGPCPHHLAFFDNIVIVT